jgi:hypothetical protein
MKITIESTSEITSLVTLSGEIPARVWEGKTDSGIPVYCLVTRIAVKADADCSQFERELKEQAAPSSDAIRTFPLHLIL